MKKAVRLIRLKRSGFTLVELLIVVAIIGVLATIGVPTFRKMVQKAKKSEAKVALGALYTAENAFFAEYGTYGDNFKYVGFELEGAQSQRVYNTGFMDKNCANAANSSSLPANTDDVGKALVAVVSKYYDSTSGNYIGFYPSSPQSMPANGECTASDTSTANGSAFKAVSNGLLQAGNTTADVWTIDNTRALVNAQDGVK